MDLNCGIEELSIEVRLKAAVELNETISNRDACIAQLRGLIEHSGITGCLADGFLLRFLRARKFNIHQALASYIAYYETRSLYSEVFLNLRPKYVLHVFRDCVVARLTTFLPNGCPVIYFQPGLWGPKMWPITDIFRANVVLVEELLLRWPETQVHGVVILIDLTGFSWRQAIHMMRPSFLRQAARFLQSSTPVRVKSVHIYNEPSAFSTVYGALRPLLKPKMVNRIKMHGSSLESLHSSIPPTHLPSGSQLEGSGPPLPNTDYLASIMELDDMFKRLQHFPILRRLSSCI
ncbi:Alpha-tocopherol transfer protein [Fasciola hepatica]|uniref:Alpha-tocopherol transfer protein n=1 Tax=Fasciola hepatica TaxID=6192 RepID=A0A4E0QUM0_FASHE|nr:Alpha-tocopherol transfer protein [Fasciola hepatica]